MNDLETQLRHRVALLAQGERTFTSDHVEDLIPSIPGDSTTVERVMEVLPTIQRLTGDTAAHLLFLLAIPLGWSSELNPAPPDLRDLKGTGEPPSLYIFAPEHFLLVSDREEYRSPILETPWDARYKVEYACGRSVQERARGWEYSRTLWVRWVPSSPVIDQRQERAERLS